MKKDSGIVSITCLSNFNCPIEGVVVTMMNSCGVVVHNKISDYHGRVVFPIDCTDEYRLRAKTNCGYSPVGQNKLLYLTPKDRCSFILVFNKLSCRKMTGTLVITLSDANYPEYLLEKGEITLWRGLK